MTDLQLLLGGLAGSAVGFTLGLVGGGGSILAVPLMVYLVGVRDPHVAIGTSALAVAANALIGLNQHARNRHVKWRCATTFATAGIAGALIGSEIGKTVDGHKMLVLFSLLMLVVAALMFRSRNHDGDATVVLNAGNAPRLVAAGAATGLLSGFFGIGGGFLVVPGLIASTGMPILFALGSSLVAVAAFGLATGLSYASEGLVAWGLVGAFIGGGAIGSLAGAGLASRLADRKGTLHLLLAVLIVFVALYMLHRAASELGWA